MKLTLKYFASLREALGPGGALDWTPAAAVGEPTAAALRDWLCTQSQAHAQALAPGRAVRVAIDQRLATDATSLHDGAEVAFFPPVTGG
jgi:molybdopterin synthase sulfur carrier subunit